MGAEVVVFAVCNLVPQGERAGKPDAVHLIDGWRDGIDRCGTTRRDV